MAPVLRAVGAHWGFVAVAKRKIYDTPAVVDDVEPFYGYLFLRLSISLAICSPALIDAGAPNTLLPQRVGVYLPALHANQSGAPRIARTSAIPSSAPPIRAMYANHLRRARRPFFGRGAPVPTIRLPYGPWRRGPISGRQCFLPPRSGSNFLASTMRTTRPAVILALPLRDFRYIRIERACVSAAYVRAMWPAAL